MRVLITGGAGFLGSHLCDYFLEKGYEVICLDNLITGNLRNISHILSDKKLRKRFKFVKRDITNYIWITGKLHGILHFASPASPIDYAKIPIQTLKAGGLGTHNTLGLARMKKARYLLASTSEVYGDPLVNPQPETYWGNVNPVGPRGCYDEAKRFAEALVTAYRNIHHVDTRIARIFNTYGPRMRKNDGRVVPNFLNQAISNKPITVYGDGSQTRSFCYVSDWVEGIYRLYKSDIQEPENIGNPTEMTVRQLAQEIIHITKSKSKIVYKTLPVDDPQVRRPDIARAKKLLKWEPKVSLRDGLKMTIATIKK